jgi:hypothetical protein
MTGEHVRSSFMQSQPTPDGLTDSAGTLQPAQIFAQRFCRHSPPSVLGRLEERARLGRTPLDSGNSVRYF